MLTKFQHQVNEINRFEKFSKHKYQSSKSSTLIKQINKYANRILKFG